MPVEVHVVTPEAEVWSGEADLVIARGTDGEVGIQQGHMPLLIRMAIGPLRLQQGSAETKMVIDGGFMHVATEGGITRVDVMADQAILAEEIDVAAARVRVEEFQKAAAEGDETAVRELRKAEARVRLAS